MIIYVIDNFATVSEMFKHDTIKSPFKAYHVTKFYR